MIKAKTAPFNPAKHAELLAQGYEYTHHEANWYEVGDAESGPSTAGDPAYDEYRNATETVVIDEAGIIHRGDDSKFDGAEYDCQF